MMLYIDASALVKLFIHEPHTEFVHAAIQTASSKLTRLVASDLAYVEVIATFSRYTPDPEQRNQLVAEFMKTWNHFVTVPMDRDLLQRAGSTARTHRLRAMDAIHLASAIQERTKSDQFLVFDAELADAAAKEGFNVLTAC